MQIHRYPSTQNKSLQAYSAADRYILRYLQEEQLQLASPLIYQDRFGYLSCHLAHLHPQVVLSYKSQEKALRKNIKKNKLNEENITLLNPLSTLEQNSQWVLLRIPKSLDLLRLYFQQMSPALNASSRVICGFMTKYFSPQILDIAAEYFEVVEQSRAWKKSRLLVLSQPKPYQERSMIRQIALDSNQSLQQYFGVFSAHKIDWATQFLMEHLQLPDSEEFDLLDLACGNGILAYAVRNQRPASRTHLLDDSFLAIASAKLNLGQHKVNYYYNDNLEDLEDQSIDYVISNPPFHFEYETNIEVAIRLFGEVKRVLRKGGTFQLVANQHLNYKTHLVQLFSKVQICASNDKFIIYSCEI